MIPFMLFLTCCVTKFIPQTNENPELLVVEGLITDQPGANTLKLSSTLPLGIRSNAKPLTGYYVTITDDLGNMFYFIETDTGTYVSDPSIFKGTIGRFYTLHINPSTDKNIHRFESYPIEMKPVPPIDSIYYEKVEISDNNMFSQPPEGCQIFLNTHDPTNQCRYYRWEYTETWEFRIPYNVPNSTCWISSNSDKINIKSTGSLAETRILRYKLNYISNQSDRLKVKYSILVNQYSLNEDEYLYWEKLQNISTEVGSLYDITPAYIPSNISCTEDPNEQVLGYFSVSARSSKRIFIKDSFSGQVDLYSTCPSDTIAGSDTISIPGLNESVWVIVSRMESGMPPYRIITDNKGCADCSVRGTPVKPAFWRDDK